MIVTNLRDKMINDYKKVNPRFDVAFEALFDLAAKNPEDGKYEIDGTNVYALVMTGPTKPVAEKKFEVHRDYIDIQYIVSGSEIMGYETMDKLTPAGEYKPDVQKLHMNEEYDKIIVSAGEFAVFFPDEPHAPGIAVNDVPSEVKKIVVKVLA